MTESNYIAISPIMRRLLELTNSSSKEQKNLMGFLADEDLVTPVEFQAFFESIAQGVDYVYQRFGTTFDEFEIVDDGIIHMRGRELDSELNFYQYMKSMIFKQEDPEPSIIYILSISRSDMLFLIKCNKNNKVLTNPKTEPYYVEPMEMAFLYGVEEAYHQHQFRTEPEKYLPHIQPLVDINNPDPEYRNNIIEKDAEIIVRMAAKEFGIFKEENSFELENKMNEINEDDLPSFK